MAHTSIKADELERIAAMLRRMQNAHMQLMAPAHLYPLLERVDVHPRRGAYGILRDGTVFYADGEP